ncbi:uncharacterized protein LOC119030479 [Acanthopagrus latus]|uniref:uncharacterized protein LOC119030479 n=1 Tax=Acanthopagrus latus TaxID=8177 RepID=UPI00187C35F3|nr:uncharacterized protein LOC119030479 [Acanthopagrus latus]
MSWRCVICLVFVALTLRMLLGHVNSRHGRSPNFHVTCGVDGCAADYRVYNSFFYHLKRKHRAFLASGRPPRRSAFPYADSTRLAEENYDIPIIHGCVTSDGTRAAPSQQEGLDGWDTVPEHGHTGTQNPVEDPEHQDSNLEPMPIENPENLGEASFGVFGHSLTQHAAAFSLNVRERCYLSQGNVNSVVADVQQYQASLLDNLRGQIKNAFDTHVGNKEKLQTAVLAVFDDFKDPFTKVSSTHLQDSSIRHFFHPVEPEEVVISQTACRIKGGNSRALTVKTNSFCYVPLFKSLEELFSDPRIFTMISCIPKRCKEGFLYDIADGEFLRHHPLFSVRHAALQLILYTDEIEICNPLGSHATMNKLLMVYYTLGNIDPNHRCMGLWFPFVGIH